MSPVAIGLKTLIGILAYISSLDVPKIMEATTWFDIDIALRRAAGEWVCGTGFRGLVGGWVVGWLGG